MTYDPYEAASLDSYEPFVGKDIGVVLGVVHEGLTLAATASGSTKIFTFATANQYPVYPEAMASTVGAADITVYDDGVAVTVSDFDESTWAVTLASTPATESVITADYTEQFEPYIAQNVDISPKYTEKDYSRLRSALKKKMYPEYEVTVKIDLLAADFEVLKLAFDSTDSDQMFEEPPTVRAFLIADPRTATEDTRVLFIPEGRLNFPKLLSAKAGADFAETSIEIACDSRPVLKEFSA